LKQLAAYVASSGNACPSLPVRAAGLWSSTAETGRNARAASLRRGTPDRSRSSIRRIPLRTDASEDRTAVRRGDGEELTAPLRIHPVERNHIVVEQEEPVDL
jgi:hypothetical protein